MWGNKPPLPCLPRLEKTRQRRTRHFFHQRKKAIVTDGLSLNLMLAVYGGRPARHPPGRCFATFKSAPGGFVLVGRVFTDKQQIKKGPVFRLSLSFYLMPWQFPTLAWGDPTLPSALRRFTSEFGMGSGGTTALRPPGKFCFIRPLLRSDLICIRLKIFSHPPKHLRRCKVKPHGSLVPVSSTHRCAYTPGLSTSSSSTFLQDSQGVRENSSRGKFRA